MMKLKQLREDKDIVNPQIKTLRKEISARFAAIYLLQLRLELKSKKMDSWEKKDTQDLISQLENGRTSWHTLLRMFNDEEEMMAFIMGPNRND